MRMSPKVTDREINEILEGRPNWGILVHWDECNETYRCHVIYGLPTKKVSMDDIVQTASDDNCPLDAVRKAFDNFRD